MRAAIFAKLREWYIFGIAGCVIFAVFMRVICLGFSTGGNGETRQTDATISNRFPEASSVRAKPRCATRGQGAFTGACHLRRADLTHVAIKTSGIPASRSRGLASPTSGRSCHGHSATAAVAPSAQTVAQAPQRPGLRQ